MKRNWFIIAVLICVIALSNFTNSIIKDNDISRIDTSSDDGSDTIQFHFIDVGQGDCILIKAGKTNILIDSGTQESGSDVYRYLKEQKINYLDYFIGTHPHEDHLGGASSVLSAIDVGTVFINKDSSTSYFYEKFIDTLLDKNITPVFPDMNCIYKVGPLKFKFLSPANNFDDENDNSIVTMVEFKDIKALFMGDAERKVEAELLKKYPNLDADILKIGHHGSRYASSAEFLNKVYPYVSVIQCGLNNTYGHPHREVIDRLNAINSTILRTDESGSVILTSDGKTIWNEEGTVFERKTENKINLVYIGNTKSKILHTETCPNLPGNKNRVEFSSIEEALNKGYKACGNCNP